MNAWKYTAAERRTIDGAYAAVCYVADHMGHNQPHALREALKYERRERSCTTVAKALLVAGFANGRKHNPRASELATVSNGIMVATIVGADSRRFDVDRIQSLANLDEIVKAAAAAHDSYMDRNVKAALEEIKTAAAG
jgi:hypothetical protein